MPDFESLVALVHASPCRFVAAITGGGSGALAQWLRWPGGSRTLLAGFVPYSAAALAEFLGAPPEHACAAATARAMAMASYQRAARLASPANQLAGLACTASLASDRPKRGPHRLHIALQTAERTSTWSLELDKGARDRSQEEDLATLALLGLAASAHESSLPAEPLAKLATAIPLVGREEWQCRVTLAQPSWRELLLGERALACVPHPAQKTPPVAVFPGAFHPRHAGHTAMARLACEILAAPVEFEISLENVDKPALDYTEIEIRLAQFAPHETVWLTRAPTFLQKARLFPGATFVVGADTIERIASLKYYGGHERERDAALREIASLGCRFLVFGRRIGPRFQSLAEIELPPALRGLCREVDEPTFRQDVSSTELRRAASHGDD